MSLHRLLELVRPAREHLPSYLDALRRGWSPDNLRDDAAEEEIAAIARDEARFLAGFEDREGDPIRLPDGSRVPRLPGFRRWIWDGQATCGIIGARWQDGTAELPPHVLGHIGYAVVPWRRGEGIGTQALAMMLELMRPLGLPHVELTCKPDNEASICIIQNNGGVLMGPFERPAVYGGGTALRWQIGLRG
jgi:predicted acetyltransferase